MSDIITLAHGSGGKLTHDLIRDIFIKHFSNDILTRAEDSAVLDVEAGRLAFTTDSFVITPVFFKGGDIGKLAVCGTVNDLAASGARPLYLGCGFIIEEAFPIRQLEEIAASMAETAAGCGVKIVAGDTKVVQRGAADKIFINTSGIGIIPEGINISASNAKPGDSVIITGTIGDHGCSILLEREMLGIKADIKSDCAALSGLTGSVLPLYPRLHVMRDPTRGGVAAALNEIASQSGVCIRLYENALPVREDVMGVCGLLGMEPLYMANEGKMLIIAPADISRGILDRLKKHEHGKDSAIIGEVLEAPSKRVLMTTLAGGDRIIEMPSGDQLPRIC
ncbi:hydrogenase expression/formation protein HypE [Anaerobacterium chartisolvens]|uniref:Hydrogenase expression/formation protein HypE n=1 Tax=Anaerobacterium chartisolvens TaxID=1297424 RepID=A0A369ATB4_9FIRM|nr:hydrogenase expression/formation protein HypE [Anaerobacterium chartisolvens]RCX12223.1 hydrogenase expression/formation protein HypE [Anaerobacterium chartisolvens]